MSFGRGCSEDSYNSLKKKKEREFWNKVRKKCTLSIIEKLSHKNGLEKYTTPNILPNTILRPLCAWKQRKRAYETGWIVQ